MAGKNIVLQDKRVLGKILIRYWTRKIGYRRWTIIRLIQLLVYLFLSNLQVIFASHEDVRLFLQQKVFFATRNTWSHFKEPVKVDTISAS